MRDSIAKQLLVVKNFLSWEIVKEQLSKVIPKDDVKVMTYACMLARTEGKQVEPEDLIDFLLIGKDCKDIYGCIQSFIREFRNDPLVADFLWQPQEVEDKIQDARLEMIMA